MSPAGRAPSVEEIGQRAALLFLAGDLIREDAAVDVRVDGGEDQAEFVRLERFDFPLHGVFDVETVAAREGQPSRVAALALVAGSS
ncbi:hypothetical protein AB0D13_35600 [Streptomyces sp. NPDC048430]|uniref:hypothetical protein n=1 Tax=unclassified Streptomyces TaxID=2593676 RepID=UPI003437E519